MSFNYLEILNYTCYYKGADAEWVVFLHGAGGSIATWKKQVDSFREYFNLLLIDLRDHGASKNILPEYEKYSFEIVSKDIKKVLDTVGVHEAHFVSLSFGSILIQDYELRYPETIKKIVVAGGVFSGTLWIRTFVWAARFFNIFLSYRQMYSIFSYAIMPYKRNQIARKIYQKHASALSQKEYLKWVGLYHEFFNLLRTFQEKQSNNQMLIVMGGDDYVFLKGAANLADSQSNIELNVLPKVGHIANIEASDKFNELSLNFLTFQEERQPSSRPSDTNSHVLVH